MADRGSRATRRRSFRRIGRYGCGIVLSAAGVIFLTANPVLAQAPSGGAVTLQAELRQLLESHPSLRAGMGKVNAARERKRGAFAGFLPKVELSAGGGREVVDSPGTRALSSDGPEQRQFRRNTTLTVTQNLFDGFATTEGRGRADSQLKVEEFRLETLRQRLLFDGVSRYHRVLRGTRLVALARQNVAVLKRQLKLEDERVQRGSGIAVDVLLAKTRLQLAIERRVQLSGLLEEQEARYAQVFGHPPTQSRMQAPAIKLPALEEKLDRAIAIAKENNPELGVSGNQIEVEAHRKRVARAGYFPELNVVGTGNWERDLDGIQGERNDWSVTLRAKWALFSGFATRAGVSAAAFEEAAARNTHRDKLRKVAEELQISLQKLKTVRRRVELLENAVNIAQEVFTARRKLRDAGR
ncbi:MAG: TolC family protein, partial [Alphaproteobacteria bacterium]